MFRARRCAADVPSFFSTCYSWRGNLQWISDYLTGPNHKHRGLTNFGPRNRGLTEIDPLLRIAFLGDVMCLEGRPYTIDADLRAFFEDVDFLVVNLEGLPADSKPRVILGQHQPRSFFQRWADNIFPVERTACSLANNHAGDFGLEALLRESTWLRSRGFRVFGTADDAHVDLNDYVRVTAATAWNNQSGQGISQFRKRAEKMIVPESRPGLNILFLHWGQEFQLYPTPAQIDEGHCLSEDWDAVIGHHAHCPQPVQLLESAGQYKLVAYSLGNFCTWRPRALLRYGMALKLACGPDSNGEWKLGSVDWVFTHVTCSSDGASIRLSPSCPLILNP